ncbi:Uncharacterised protein [Neisseria gonorrhoeae]|uniref:Uncharacterized protein n=1 Tax=Neisseria gonorrhoeae TaxID=485 RepID=A0A378VWG3_NEIGO|nr:Uncharacterised protein [Neisseria gonorrhoeae]
MNNGERRFYVYCLTDLKKTNPLHRKGCGNRIFEHEWVASRSQDPVSGEIIDRKLKAISKCKKLGRYIISYHLTEVEALAAESALIHLLNLSWVKNSKIKLPGMVRVVLA